MNDPKKSPAETGLEVRSYFVRGRNALVTRADFGELYVDYYLHQGQHSYQHDPFHDELFKQALAAITLHCASRPWNESSAWTIHLSEPLLNLFVAGDNRLSTVVGQLFTENVRADASQIFLADVVRGKETPQRSAVDFTGNDIFRAAERYYAQSEQRLGRFFAFGPEEFVFVSAQPQCDLQWLENLTAEDIQGLDQAEQLSLLETRYYRWECGCTQERMMAVLASVMRSDPDGLFGDEPVVRISCRGVAPGTRLPAKRWRRMSPLTKLESSAGDYAERFGGVARLLGRPGLERLRVAHVCVVGVGGVGSWVVEALARSGIGALTLIDLDDVCVTNVNRQLPALDGQIGRPKIEVLAERVRLIHPGCQIETVADFFTAASAAELLTVRYDFVVDAIDKMTNKCVLIAGCRERGLSILTVGGAGGKRDGTAVRVADLAQTEQDELLRQVRRKLRRDFGFPRGLQEEFGVRCVYSPEKPVYPWSDGTCALDPEPGGDSLTLDCASGFGTATFVTGAFGFAAAGEVVRRIAGS